MRRNPIPRRRSPGQRVQHTKLRRKPFLESLEARHLMTVAAGADPLSDLTSVSGHSGLCNCPLCTGVGLDQIETVQAPAGELAASSPLSSLPQLSSRPGATAKLVLDFDGNTLASWGGYTNVVTPVFDQDGDRTTFSDGELAAIYQIWAAVAEDYAPFNIDVTTIDPGVLTDKVVAKIAIGGNYSDWYGTSSGGVAYVGGFYNSSSNVGFVFEDALGNGNPKYTADAAAHEAGHLFGLQHQALWNGTTLVSSYNRGDANWAPIMGTGYYSLRSTWYNGTTSASPTTYQDDMAILSGSNDGFGYRADDFGSTIATAATLPMSGGNVNFSGLIGQTSDADYWQFTTAGGTVNLQLAVAQYGANLDGVLELRDGSGTVITTAAPTDSLGASLSLTVGAGTYYLVVRGMGDYGDVGQYTITGSIVSSTTAPEISVSVDGGNVLDGGSIAFGSANLGSPVDKTFVVRNDGTANLNLTALNPANLPAGFSLVSNLGATTLAPGATTSFTVRLNATAAGSYSGAIQLQNDDADENPFDLTVSGTVLAPEITLRIGSTNLTDGQSVDFGTIAAGSSVTRVFTVVNDGSATLSLAPLDPAALPAGFSIVSNLGATSLEAGQSTSFTIQFAPSTSGAFGGAIGLANNDQDENPFDLTFSGTSVAPAPEITVLVVSQPIASGGLIDFGTTGQGSPLQQTITVRNDGTGTLTLTPIDPNSLPIGFSLVSNLGVATLNPGESTSFTVQFDATTVGSYAGQLTLNSNDADEGAFVIQLAGQVVMAEPIVKQIADDGDAGNSLSGAWRGASGKGYASDVHTAKKGAGGTVSSWSFSNLPDGTYQVWATWTAAGTNASNAPYTISVGGQVVASVKVSQRVAPSGLTADGDNWKLLGTVSVTGGQLSVKLSNAANGTVVADAVRIERVLSANAPLPDIGVQTTGGYELTCGSTINYGVRELYAGVSYTFTVVNRGHATLSLQPIDPASLPAGFKLVSNLSSTLVLPGESTSFSIELDDSAVGTFAGTLQILSSDHDVPAFTVHLKGSVFDPTQVYVRQVDDGNMGSGFSGAWSRTTGHGSGSDIHTATAGTGSKQARWNFYELPSGQYRVYSTWAAASLNATNAPFTVSSGGQTLATYKVNQRTAPSGPWADGARWKLMGTVTVANGQLTVRLTNAANGSVIADAIRLERVPDQADGLPVPDATILNWMATEAAGSPAIGSTSTPAATHASSSDWQPELDVLNSTASLLAYARQRVSSAMWNQSSDASIASLFGD